MNIDGFEERKKSLSFIIKESDFFLSSKPSMFLTLCHTLVGCLIIFVYICLNCVFLLRGSQNTDETPSPLAHNPDLFKERGNDRTGNRRKGKVVEIGGKERNGYEGERQTICLSISR